MADKSFHNQAKEIFAEALQLEKEKRAEYLDGVCQSNPNLRKEIESLLESFEKSNDFIEKPLVEISKISAWQKVSEVLGLVLEKPKNERLDYLKEICGEDKEIFAEVESLLAFDTSNFPSQSPLLLKSSVKDKSIGNYNLIKEIGHGGMGVVYLASRNDDFRKRVAIKLVKGGLDSKEVLRRFKNERQILASLQHPNIAQLLDGGTTEDGIPYFVMEYIEGLPLLQYCDEHQLSTNERLDLFKTICSAVQHAHQNLVIHRDLKPNNILVTHQGEVKLLDFGVAKFLNPELVGELNQTQTQFRVMTPEYASPEQIKGTHITTASDIYSLGVILYELLTGERPFKFEGKNLEQIFQTVREVEPIAPSSIFSEKVVKESPKSKIQNLKSFKGDLDNIALMALRKEPVRRYKSVEQLSDDIQKHLKGLPVIARPNTFSYRAEKFFKRNLAATAIGALLILTLVSGLIISLRQTSIAYTQEKKAITEAEKSRKITRFMEKVLSYANPAWYAEGYKLNGQAKLIEVLDDLSGKIETEFPNDLDIQAELHHKSAEIYLMKNNLPKALFHAETALKIRRSIFGERNAEVAKDMYYLASVYKRISKYNQMKKLYEEAAAIFREVDPNNANLPFLLEDFGNFLRDIGDYDQAQPIYSESLELLRKKDGEIHYNTARLYMYLAIIHANKGETAKADEYYQAGEKRFSQFPDKNLSNFFVSAQARYEIANGNLSNAEKLLETSIAENTSDRDSKLAKYLLVILRLVYLQDKNYQKLADLSKKELERAKQDLPRDEIKIGLINLEIATALYRSENNEEAAKYFDEGFPVYKNLPADSLSRLNFNENIGECLFNQKRYAEAKPILENVIAFYAESYPPNHEDIPKFKEMLDKTKANLKE